MGNLRGIYRQSKKGYRSKTDPTPQGLIVIHKSAFQRGADLWVTISPWGVRLWLDLDVALTRFTHGRGELRRSFFSGNVSAFADILCFFSPFLNSFHK